MTDHHTLLQPESGQALRPPSEWAISRPKSPGVMGRPVTLPQLRTGRNRSMPIAIVKSSDKHYNEGGDTDSDDDSSTIDLELDALRIAGASGSNAMISSSLPSHLLRAPRLGSLPAAKQNNTQNFPTMMPPSATSIDDALTSSVLSGVDVRGQGKASYGSLRDSNSRGRFMDGPSSYRDKTTGNVRFVEQRLRFGDNKLASSLPATMSIGDRIMKTRLRQKEASKVSPKIQPLSSLSALMESSSRSESYEASPQMKPLPAGQRMITFYDETYTRSLPDNVLSTSLTGLEILQSGLKARSNVTGSPPATVESLQTERSENRNDVMKFGHLEELPRDCSGNNLLLARSSSDPTPEHLSSPALRTRPSPSPHLSTTETRGAVSPLHLYSAAPNSDFTMDGNVPSIQNLPQTVVSPFRISSSPKENPDTECGFDLDIE